MLIHCFIEEGDDTLAEGASGFRQWMEGSVDGEGPSLIDMGLKWKCLTLGQGGLSSVDPLGNGDKANPDGKLQEVGNASVLPAVPKSTWSEYGGI